MCGFGDIVANGMAAHNLEKHARKYWDKAQEYHRRYALGRNALYALCGSARHDDPEATVSKLWLVGRSHSAALERTHVPQAERKKEPYWRAAEALRKLRVDEKLDAVRKRGESYDDAHVEAIDACVASVTDALSHVMGQRKLSLATKYLHFHAPALPIFDSVSQAVYKSFIDQRGGGEGKYGTHVRRFVRVRDALNELGHAPATARAIDNFAMYWWYD